MLRAIPNKYLGIAFMFGSLLILLKLPTINIAGNQKHFAIHSF